MTDDGEVDVLRELQDRYPARIFTSVLPPLPKYVPDTNAEGAIVPPEDGDEDA